MGRQQNKKDNRSERKREPGVVTAELVGEPLRWRLLLLRYFNQPKNAIERAPLQAAGRSNDCLPVEIKCAAAHRIADLFHDRNRFASQRRFIR